jgi:hypothetical protein
MSSPAPPSTSELVEGVLFYPIALVISATIAPGMLLCIPGLLFVTVLVLVPIVAMAIVALLAAAVVAVPVVLVRKLRGSRAVSKPQSHGAVSSTVFGRPLVALSADRSRPHLTPAELR